MPDSREIVKTPYLLRVQLEIVPLHEAVNGVCATASSSASIPMPAGCKQREIADVLAKVMPDVIRALGTGDRNLAADVVRCVMSHMNDPAAERVVVAAGLLRQVEADAAETFGFPTGCKPDRTGQFFEAWCRRSGFLPRYDEAGDVFVVERRS